MRRSFLFFIVVLAAVALASCGHSSSSSSSSTETGTHIALTPGITSIIPGRVVTFTAQEQNSSNTALTKQPTIIFTAGTGLTLSKPNCSVVGVTGCQVEACAGTFDPSFVHCTPGSAVGQTSVTAAADNFTTSASIFVHLEVTSVSITPSSTSGCVSSGGTQNFTAAAFNNGTDITTSVGPISWGSTSTSVVTVNSNGLATAASPGTAAVFASATNSSGASSTSSPATFNTCAVKNISFHVSGAPDTSFSTTFPATTQQQLVTDVTDVSGKTVSSGLTFTVIPAALGTFSGATFSPASGGTGAIVASCAPPSCNIGLNFDTFSNPVVANVSGTVSGSVWVASTAGKALVSIAPATNTAGTPVTLPAQPNSLIVGSGQKNAYLGSSSGLMVVALSASTVNTIGGATGRVLAVDPLEQRVIVSNGTNVFVVTVSSSQVQTLNIAGATAAAWTPDGFYAYIVAGSNAAEYQSSTGLVTQQFNLTSPAADVAFLTNGQFAYFAQTSAVTVRRPCDNLQTDSIPTSGAPHKIRATTNNATVFAVDTTSSSTGFDIITPAITSGTGCGQAVTDTTKFRDFGVGVFTPTQLITTPDSNYAFVTGASNLVGYNLAQDQVISVALTGGAQPLSGDALLDSSSLYIGGSDGNVHQLTISNGTITDAAQVAVSSAIGGNPDLVAFIQR